MDSAASPSTPPSESAYNVDSESKVACMVQVHQILAPYHATTMAEKTLKIIKEEAKKLWCCLATVVSIT